MDQNQTTVDNDLQKAIDDIKKTTSTDPVFSDPVAAPSSVPEGDTGELSEPVGPFPTPEPVAPLAPEPTPVAEQQPVMEQPIVEQTIVEQPIVEQPVMEQPAPVVEQPIPPMTPEVQTPEFSAPPIAETETFETITTNTPAQNLNMHQVKEAALRDLVPLIDRLNMDAEQKFNLYRDIFENMKDYTVLEPAYRIAKEITDETKRAEALFYLIESIDKM